MKLAACLVAVACFAVGTGCADDRVEFSRGPLGPAAYEVRVNASSEATEFHEQRRATLRVEPRSDGARFAMRTSDGALVTADLDLLPDGSVDLTRVQGAAVQPAGQTELASLVGQLNPPLPSGSIRLGERWSSTQRITTRVLRASLSTELRMVRFRRIASTDAAELVGQVSGRLRVTDAGRTLEGRLTGDTMIVWAVSAGRVVAADTELLWELSDGSRVTLETSVRPR